MSNMETPNTVVWDAETKHLMSRIWRTGEQYIRHDQLVEGFDQYDIICIAYAWNDEPVKVLGWGRYKQDSSKLIVEFDKIIAKADIVIGKNSDRFDNKQLNTLRWLHGLPAPAENWIKKTDDLEKQIRKHFYLPSNSLDYISKLRGLGGKRKMEMQDWIDVVEGKQKAAYEKMLDYCCKDVEDTRALWNDVKAHITPKFNHSAYQQGVVCINCGSENIRRNGKRLVGTVWKQGYYCNDHGGFAGYRTISARTDGEVGGMR